MKRQCNEEERKFFIEFVPGHSYKEIMEEFNRRFPKHISINQVKAYIHNHRLNTGRTGYFEKGHIPFNKGKHFIAGGRSSEARYKKGHVPHNHCPVGEERITTNGYIKVKIAEPRTWKFKHKIVYEEHYGPLKKGEVIIFKDRNKLNVSPDNLMAVSRGALARMNQNHWLCESAELTEVGATMAKIITTLNAKRRQK